MTDSFRTENYAPQPYGGGNSWADHRRVGEFNHTELPDLADRRIGAGVIAANDEFFAIRENLLTPERPEFQPGVFGPKGQVMDGWETRRRRGESPDKPLPAAEEHDWALIRLGTPGLLRTVVIDTAHFRGNYPETVSLEGAALDGHPSEADLLDPSVTWEPLLTRIPTYGHAANGFTVDNDKRFTHLRLSMQPDGGIARLRVHGEPLPEPDWLAALGTFDVAALENGGLGEDASNGFYSAADNMLRPGRSRDQADGWETGRRREGDRDWARIRLCTQSTIRAVEVDTTQLKGNAPDWFALLGCDATTSNPEDPASWFPIIEPTALQPDTPHRFPVSSKPTATHVRLDAIPDGGLARLRIHGTPTEAGHSELRRRWDAAR